VLSFKTCFGQVPRVPEHPKAELNNKKKMPTKIHGKDKKGGENR